MIWDNEISGGGGTCIEHYDPEYGEYYECTSDTIEGGKGNDTLSGKILIFKGSDLGTDTVVYGSLDFSGLDSAMTSI